MELWLNNCCELLKFKMRNKGILFVLTLVMSTYQSCIPLKTVNPIEGYKIVEGKPNSRKEIKRFTKFKFSNYHSTNKSISFLKTKFKVFTHREKAYVTHKIFSDLDINFNLEFRFYEDESKYISLLNLFSKDKRDSNDPYYNEEIDEPVQSGDVYKFIEVTIKDDALTDYLNLNSPVRERLISYLKELSIAHNFYIKNTNF